MLSDVPRDEARSARPTQQYQLEMISNVGVIIVAILIAVASWRAIWV